MWHDLQKGEVRKRLIERAVEIYEKVAMEVYTERGNALSPMLFALYSKYRRETEGGRHWGCGDRRQQNMEPSVRGCCAIGKK